MSQTNEANATKKKLSAKQSESLFTNFSLRFCFRVASKLKRHSNIRDVAFINFTIEQSDVDIPAAKVPQQMQ